MKATYYGHSCFGFDIGGYNVVVDPFVKPNPLTAGKVDFTAIKADYILITHAHWDHLADAKELAEQTGATIIANWEIASHYEAQGIKVHKMNIGGKWPFEFGTVRLVPAVHSSSFPDGSYGGTAGGFVIETDEKAIYIAGDTALFSDMQIIGQQHKLTAAFLPVGDNLTMGVEDAVSAARFVNTKKLVAMHFDTFPLIMLDREELKMRAFRAEIEAVVPEIGVEITL